MVGPPKQFDRDEALGRALEVFWAKGFEATSMQDLVDHMGINRASMYDTFGNKHALFSRAVDWYATQVLGDIARILEAPGSPLGNKNLFLRVLLPDRITSISAPRMLSFFASKEGSLKIRTFSNNRLIAGSWMLSIENSASPARPLTERSIRTASAARSIRFSEPAAVPQTMTGFRLRARARTRSAVGPLSAAPSSGSES